MDETAVLNYVREKQITHGYGILCGLDIGPLSNFDVETGYLNYNPESDSFYVVKSMASESVFDPALAESPTFLLMENQFFEENSNILSDNLIIRSTGETTTIGQYHIFLFESNPFTDPSSGS